MPKELQSGVLGESARYIKKSDYAESMEKQRITGGHHAIDSLLATSGDVAKHGDGDESTGVRGLQRSQSMSAKSSMA
jgi:hypothetical protein